ncbi:siphovirus Gp157 family protein [Halobacillus karajensis]|uniref:Siphovirus Gp157 n=1 Tax=Halobacillus karajensis TaxID=195088 RepID=A0A059NWA2_9BACI|nr:siphovirus Gp157 family protein [Halobacillus karajensis]CDQ22620.1 Siphovirus Gp157 [Halobacillus karajensis]CDQ26102.1 Siphovirus Gp157 [Halobacillus karajensis]
MASLYELHGNYLELQQMIEDGHEGLEDTLQSIEDAIPVKLENTARIIRNLEAENEMYKAEEKRLADRRKSNENSIKRLKEGIQMVMESSGNKKVKTPLFSFGIQNNPPSVHVTDDTAIPKDFFIPVDPKLDKKMILKLLKEGNQVPGAELKQSESLRIR